MAVAAAKEADPGLAPVPPHVDPRLVVDFDYLHPPGFTEDGDLYEAWRTLHAGPDVVWTPRNGGHWILTRSDDIAWAQRTYEIFSHREFIVPRGEIFSLPPLTLDPPDNVPFRAVLTPSFTPKQVREAYEPKIRALTVDLIEQLRPRGACDFVQDFAFVMPVSIFLGIADLPLSRREEFLGWARGMGDAKTRPASAQAINSYLTSVLDERGPGDDLLGRIAAAREDPKFENKAEVVTMAMVVFSGGLDTVAALLSFAMLYLAGRPDLQQRLREEPAIIPDATEEFLRRYGLSATSRLITQEFEHKGAHFMPGDMAMVPSVIAGLDDRLYPNAMEIDFDRDAAPHATFGNGPHKCVGQFLARAELRIFLEEWFQRMPAFRLDPERPPKSAFQVVATPTRLNLLWEV